MSNLKRKLPNWIEAFMEYTENSESPKMFRKWTAISCIAAALMRKVRVDWGTTLTWYPNLYIVLVGPSATGKGTAMAPGLKILKEIPAIKLSAQATSLQALISHIRDINLTDINSATGEATFHSSISIFSEEFTVFLGYRNNEMMSTLCDWYDCKDEWSYDTIKRSRERLIGVWVNILGGTTPDLLRLSMPPEMIGIGLASRIIFIYEENPDKVVIFPTETEREKELFQDLVHDLELMTLLTGNYSWTESFMSVWADWCNSSLKNPPFYDSKFDGYIGRRRVHLMKLAMIMSASRGENDLVMSGEDLKLAIAALEEAEQKMALVFKGIGKSDISELVFRSHMFFKTAKSDEIPYYQFARYLEGDADKFTLDRVINTLEAMNIIRLIRRPGADAIIKLIK